MYFPYLAQILDLIRTYTPYKSNATIGDKIGVSDSAVRNWYNGNTGKAGHVPDDAAELVMAFVQDILPSRLPRDAVQRLMQGHPIYFHNALCPVGGRAWSNLLKKRLSEAPLETEIAPPAARLGFGEVEGVEEPSDWEIGPRWRYAFGIPACRNDGEALLLAERRGEWRPTEFDGRSRTMPVSGNPWLIPGRRQDGARRFISNDGTLGIIRYIAIAVGGVFPNLVHEALAAAVPFDQMTLDALGDALSLVSADNMVARATVLRVGPKASLAEDAQAG